MDVLSYYPPDSSRYFECEQTGDISKSSEDSKIASTKIEIRREIPIKELVKSSISFITSKATKGDCAHSVTNGDNAHSVTNGNWAYSATNGKNSIAAAFGFEGRAKGKKGNYIVLAEFGENRELLKVKAHKVDGKTVKPDTWYMLKGGKFTQVDEDPV